MLRFLLGSLLLATIIFRLILIFPIYIPGALQLPWFCDKPCPLTFPNKNVATYLPNLLSQNVDLVSACKSFCTYRDQMWAQLQIPSAEVKNLYTTSAKFTVFLLGKKDIILTVMLQGLVFLSFPMQVLYFLSVFLCTACCRLLNKMMFLNALAIIGCAGYHVYRMWEATQGNLDPMEAFAEVGLEGVIVPLILLLLIASTPRKTSGAKGVKARKLKQK